MKLTRRDAITAFNGLSALERGADGKPFNFEFETWNRIFEFTLCLTPVAEAYNKARRQRFLQASNGENKLEGEAEVTFLTEEEKIMEQTISVKMPKKLLTNGELNLPANKIPPSIRMQIRPLVNGSALGELDDDENNY